MIQCGSVSCKAFSETALGDKPRKVVGDYEFLMVFLSAIMILLNDVISAIGP
jgi:hypothetical protein